MFQCVVEQLRGYVLDKIGDAGTGVFVVDETGFLKKGVRSTGVARQYTGTSGKIDNCHSGRSWPIPRPELGR
jgi:SRSO17 transposase